MVKYNLLVVMMTQVTIILSLLLLASCSLIDKLAVRKTADLIQKASYEIETEASLSQFAAAVPGNIKLIEGFLSLDPENSDLLSTLVKAHAGHAFAVFETEHLAEQLDDVEDGPYLKQAIFSYSKAIDYALRYLMNEAISYGDLQLSTRGEGGVPHLLERQLSGNQRDLETVFFLAHSLGSLVNLQKSNMTLIAELPVVKGLFDYVCAKKPDFNYGACDLFYGAYEAGRPKMLGGDHVKGRNYFEGAIKKFPENILTYVSYIQYYQIPLSDQSGYQKLRGQVISKIEGLETVNTWRPSVVSLRDRELSNHMNLYNQIAKRRFEIIKKRENKLF